MKFQTFLKLRNEISNIPKEIRRECEFSRDINFIDHGMLDLFDIVNLVSRLDERICILIVGLYTLPEFFTSIELIANLFIYDGAKQ